MELNFSPLVLLLLFLLANHSFSSENYAPHRYDRSSSQFSPSGRILQAEYALKASKRYINEEEDYFEEETANVSKSAIPSCDRVTVTAATNNGGGFGTNSTFASCIVTSSTPLKYTRNKIRVFPIAPKALFFSPTIGGELNSPESDASYLRNRIVDRIGQHITELGVTPSTETMAGFGDQASHELTLHVGVRPIGCEGVVVGDEGIFVLNAMQCRGGVWGLCRGGVDGMKRGEKFLKRIVVEADKDKCKTGPTEVADQKNFDVVNAAFFAMVDGNGKENCENLVCNIYAIKAKVPNLMGYSDEQDDEYSSGEDQIKFVSGVTLDNFEQKRRELEE